MVIGYGIAVYVAKDQSQLIGFLDFGLDGMMGWMLGGMLLSMQGGTAACRSVECLLSTAG